MEAKRAMERRSLSIVRVLDFRMLAPSMNVRGVSSHYFRLFSPPILEKGWRGSEFSMAGN